MSARTAISIISECVGASPQARGLVGTTDYIGSTDACCAQCSGSTLEEDSVIGIYV